MSAGKFNGKTTRAFDTEIIAEVGALELLCPAEARLGLVKKYDNNIDTLCDDFGVPRTYGFAFTEEFVKFSADL
jgi:hypothetical protein